MLAVRQALTRDSLQSPLVLRMQQIPDV